MHGKGFPWHRCKQGCLTKGGWHREENSAGSSRLGSLRALWSLCLGKIGVEEGGAEKADAQQRDSKWEGNVLRAVRFCCGFAKQERQHTAAHGSPRQAFLPLPPSRYGGLQETQFLGTYFCRPLWSEPAARAQLAFGKRCDVCRGNR